jgi:tetratricopeptide (TPR) repeat protein
MPRRIAILLIFLGLLASRANASPEQWVEVRSAHFTVLTDSSEKQARHIVDQFERMRWMFQTLFPKSNVDPVSPIVVLAAKNQKSFQTLEPADYLAKGQMKIGGLFMRTPDKNYVLLRLDAEYEHPYSSIYHEYTHLQFSADSQWMPIWLNEGLAEFIQNTEIREKDVVLGEPSVDDILYLRQNQIIPLPVLFRVDAKSPYYHDEQKGSVFYAESWALTHYLYITDKENHTNRMGDYFNLISHREDPVTAAEKAFGDLKKLQTALGYYIQASSHKEFTLSSAAAPIDESSYKVRLLTQSESDAARADFLAYVRRNADARALLDTVLKADPTNAQAHETMGFLALHDGNMEEARKWYGEAVKLGSQNYLAQYQFAQLSMGGPDPDRDKEIEDSLRAAIRLNPRFAPPYDTLSSWLTSKERYADATAVMQDLLKVATNPAAVTQIQHKIAQIRKIQDDRAQPNISSSGVVDIQSSSTVVDIDPGPKHPIEPPTGPKHTADGVIRGVQCTEPAQIEFHVAVGAKSVTVYSNNYFKLDISALGFTPQGNMNPCTAIEGMKARVQYAESSDKTVDGQIVSIVLKK